MISHERKFIFVHIPKAAGTSIITTFGDDDGVEAESGDGPLLPFEPDANKFDPPPPHLRITDYVKYGYVTQAMFDAYFKFSFVRNPWDRLVSEYKYRRLASKYDFKTFVFEHFPRPAWRDEYCHVIPQYDFLHDTRGNRLVDYVGKLENLQQGVDAICARLGLPAQMLEHRNKSLSLLNRRDIGPYHVLKTLRDYLSIRQKRNTFSHYTEYYDQETVDFVSRIYIKDIEAFGYRFGQ